MDDECVSEFVSQVKSDFKNSGKQMSECRQSLESWIEFVNPYQRLRRAADQLAKKLDALNIDQISEPSEVLSSSDQLTQQQTGQQWRDAGVRLHKAFGICFGIRAMLPVMAEAFVNLMLYVLSCLDDRVRTNVEQVISSMELGLHETDDRVGVLFADHLVDFRSGPPAESV